MNFEYPAGATPLDPDAASGLIPSLSTQTELNEFEEANILSATLWIARSRLLKRDYPNVTALRRVHQQMFDKTWKWAGQFRKTDTNIGIPWPHIPAELHRLCEDTRYWVENKVFPWVELGVRFHHQLVFIHPFPNGNGRHARLATDVLLRQHGQRALTWGSRSLTPAGEPRKAYISALKSADAGDYEPLTAFVQT